MIDPTLLFSTYIGGSGQGGGGDAGVAVDSSGNAYIAGNTSTNTYPTTVGVFQAACPSSPCRTPVISKFDPLGRLQYSTFLGSTTPFDQIRAIAVDAIGEVYVTGVANPGFPTTPNAYQTACGGVFMTQLNLTGTGLSYSTCLGNDGVEADNSEGFGVRGIAVDTKGKAYLTGGTYGGSGYPVTPGALQATSNGNNAYVSIIDPALTGAYSLIYSPYLGGGGSGGDSGYAIASDSYGNAYVTGTTSSRSFPVTPNAFQSLDRQATCTFGIACPTAFVAKINPAIAGPTGLIYATYLGGSGAGGDFGNAIAVDGSGNAYITGTTASSDFPVTSGAFQTTSNNNSGFVTKLSATGESLVFSTFLGQGLDPSQAYIGLYGIALDASSNVYVTGYTSGNFPITPNAFQTIYYGGGGVGGSGSGADAFLSEFNFSGSELLYSSYLGGSGTDYATAECF